MKNSILAIAILLMLPLLVKSQRVEVGLFGGASTYIGELTDQSIQLEELNPAVGGFMRYYVNPFLNLRLGLTYGVLSGNDKNSSSTTNRLRNLSFRSDVLEFAFIPEFNVIGYRDRHLFSPYIFAGVAGFYYNPKAWYKGEWVALQPLGTEGQGTDFYASREKYSLIQVSFPFGAGVKIGFNNGLNIGLEAGLRYTLTDYIDDVSTTYANPTVLIFENGVLAAALANRTGELSPDQIPFDFIEGMRRGDATNVDMYAFSGITISYTIGAGNGGLGKGGKRGCPIY